MSKIVLTPEEIGEIRPLLGELAGRYGCAENEEFLNEADVIAHDLPRRIRREVRQFRLFEPDDALLLVSGYPIDEEKIGPTPVHWKERAPENDAMLFRKGR